VPGPAEPATPRLRRPRGEHPRHQLRAGTGRRAGRGGAYSPSGNERPACCGSRFGVDQGCDGRVAAQLVQAAAAQRADAADRDDEGGADLGVGHGRVVDEQGDQLLVVRRQAGERLAQRGVPLGGQQFLFGVLGLVVSDVVGVRRQRGSLGAVRAFAPSGGGQPPRQGGRVAEVAQVFHQVQPDALAGVLDVGGAEPARRPARFSQHGRLAAVVTRMSVRAGTPFRRRCGRGPG